MHKAATATTPQRPIFFRATPKLPNASQMAYLMEYISSNPTLSNPIPRNHPRDQSYHNFKNPTARKPQETKNSQKLQNTFNGIKNTTTLPLQNSSAGKIKTTSRNPPSSPSSSVSTCSASTYSASTNFINSLTIRKKSIPFKSRFKSASNMQKFDFRQVSGNYQLRIINKKVLVSARMRNSSRIIRKFNFVLPETCDTKTFTHRLERGVLEFKWKTAMDEN
jgi:hypothetical protein